MCGCLGAALIWHTFGPALYRQLQRLYRLCFSLPIRKGWVRLNASRRCGHRVTNP
jgi:undecaprenyl-diphosphatase